MKALQWQGVNKLAVGQVPDPEIRNAGDVIVKVNRTVTCGSDLHLLGGYIPFMERGDVLGPEFVGEVIEVGSDVRRHRVGDRVVVSSFIACGRCWFCEQQLYSLCDNGNTNPAITETLWGHAPGGCFGYSHAMGGNPGSHAEYVRVPFADVGAFTVPDTVTDERALFASDSASTGWMGADLGGVKPGDVVAVWGAGAVGQMAARAAVLLGADRVVVIDRYDNRLHQAEKHAGAEILNKALTVRGAQMHGQRYIPMLLDRMARGELVTEYLATHVLPLDDAPIAEGLDGGDESLRVLRDPEGNEFCLVQRGPGES
ncbi:alcohol dehydrogenase catalytic domain-containing protein [Actinoplanes sp. NPDC026623]|uniref:alcohol dehydrogenase catalytic domain-containing protein n=1 Tax=Actinoplanes sp. NPDC026623 TaxID=3155610 RepID=UPI0033C3BFDC